MSAARDRSVTLTFAGVVVLAVLGAVVAQVVWGVAALLLVLAAGALCLTIVAMWASLQQMGDADDMTFEQALNYAAPTAAEEQKRALLRTLKDLEYELSVGKISREDYDDVSREVREKAKELIALSDETMKERLLRAEQRVAQFGKPSEDGDASSPPKKKKKKKAKSPAPASGAADASPSGERSAAEKEPSAAEDERSAAENERNTAEKEPSAPSASPEEAPSEERTS